MARCLLLIVFAVLFFGGPARGADGKSMEMLRNSSGRPVNYGGKLSSAPVLIPSFYKAKAEELRGVWVATVDNIDFPVHSGPEAFKKDWIDLLENLRRANLNAVFFQVRPMNDAFYRSALNPWSRFLAGNEGRALGNFDPLPWMIAESHKRGIQFHAWLNPYRVTKNAGMSKLLYLNTLPTGNFARINPEMVLDVYKDGKRALILDPGEPQVVSFLVSTVKEIVKNYDVDGVHFDDYFYPYSGCGNADYRSFTRYNPRKLSLDNWRVENVNSLIYATHKAVDANNIAAGKKVQFGVSPFGIWRNIKSDPGGSQTSGLESFSAQHADSRRWVKSGWVDYIAPQVYWPFEHDAAAYAAVTDWWVQTTRGTNVSLYIGHIPGYYGGSGLWRDPREIPNQLRYNLKYPEIKGEIMFSYKSLFAPDNAVMRKGADIIRQCWASPAAPPGGASQTRKKAK